MSKTEKAETSLELVTKVIGIISIIFMLTSFILLSFGMIPFIHFLIISALCAIIAFLVLPRLKKISEKRINK